MKKICRIFLVLLCFFYLLFFIENTNLWKETFINTTKLWLYKVVLGIIPMYLISSLLMSISFINNFIYNIFNKCKLFENKKALSLFIISFICGTPTTSILITKSYNNNEISYKQASSILFSCSFVSFLFLRIVLDTFTFWIISISQIITSIILYFINNHNIELNQSFDKEENIIETINDIINDLPLILLKILITMLLVSIITIPFNNLEIIFNYFEVTIGLNNIINYNINYYLKIILISSIVSFNGIAMLLQVYNITKKTRLDYKHYIKNRLYHMIISVLISLVLLLIINFIF